MTVNWDAVTGISTAILAVLGLRQILKEVVARTQRRRNEFRSLEPLVLAVQHRNVNGLTLANLRVAMRRFGVDVLKAGGATPELLEMVRRGRWRHAAKAFPLDDGDQNEKYPDCELLSRAVETKGRIAILESAAGRRILIGDEEYAKETDSHQTFIESMTVINALADSGLIVHNNVQPPQVAQSTVRLVTYEVSDAGYRYEENRKANRRSRPGN